MIITKTKEEYDRNYRRIYAMYMKGYTNDDICRECHDLPKWEVMEYIQTIYGKDQMRRERRGESY